MRFKKIYIEITNSCNLSCSFCSKSNRKKRSMTIEEFKIIIEKIKNHTNYIYLHVKGEPLLHTNLKEFLNICEDNNMNVNITTNGTLLKYQEKVLNNKVIKQINISLHSENKQINYLEDIFKTVSNLNKDISIVYRFWTLDNLKLDKDTNIIVDKIIDYYKLNNIIVNKINNEKNIQIKDNIYINKANLFIWPDQENNQFEEGYCLGGKTHIGILSDGRVVPCCLDSESSVELGNIFNNKLEEILLSDRYLNLIKGFKNNKPTEDLCRKCSFKERFDK